MVIGIALQEKQFLVQIAVQLKIPLIIWVHIHGFEQVGMYSHLDNVEMTRRYRHDHDLFGIEPKDMSDTYDDLEDNDLINFLYPPSRTLSQWESEVFILETTSDGILMRNI